VIFYRIIVLFAVKGPKLFFGDAIS
jgi:hypothetical protein